MAPRKLAAGNWKMNGDLAALAQIDAIVAGRETGCDVLICPPAVLLHPMVARVGGSGVMVGGQDCHHAASGAHTGDIAAVQLADAGASHVILGHSERRADHGESDADVAAKARAAHDAGLIAIICVGETEAERDAGSTLDVIATQLKGSIPDCATTANTVIAYEPVWAIGTGRTPDNAQIAEVHAMMRDALADKLPDASLLYGGSVKAANATEIFGIANVDGALVGGASLKASDFLPIVSALAAS
ncbi:triose-phosphate isomerase [Paracoccus sp. 1_MG-2023]|uniref:triose-phosphate isomerase n=1 Tax=unclassified Paracoccus (in: a-proteobacteria) TaxID=2688777 RepID=UPI001C097502|nr:MULTISPECIES: triose-phosphate isomerase [unclassified Paracoccus (in: a-proteobacteria)]MBU2958449.1 triose-phosphate isomerase [Paracoccus sp. C2R09]MDO6668566.1 triose-phosphate isomerase [Paracoccus sp. 1_MG-2023]